MGPTPRSHRSETKSSPFGTRWTWQTNPNGIPTCQQWATSLKSFLTRGSPHGPHGFGGGRDEIFALFEKGDPIICLQDLRIPKNKVDAVKSELHALFPHCWIYISTATINGAGSQDERGRHYNFTTLTALDSHYFLSATHLFLHPGSSKGSKREGAQKLPTAGSSISITFKTKNGGNLHIINLYQFTANDGGRQDVVWRPINACISRHPGERVILIGDMNGSIPGGRHNYADPTEKKPSGG